MTARNPAVAHREHLLDVSGAFSAAAGSVIKVELDLGVAPGTLVPLLKTTAGDSLAIVPTTTRFQVETRGVFTQLVASNTSTRAGSRAYRRPPRSSCSPGDRRRCLPAASG